MGTFPGVRFATPDDEPEVMRLLELLYEENKLARVNWDKVTGALQKGTQQQGGIVGVIDGHQRIEATVGLVMTSWWFTDEFHLEELWTFVHPDHRNSTHAKQLYEFGKWCGDQLHLPVLFGVLTVKKMQAKVRLAQRQMHQVGALFLHNRELLEAFQQREFSEPKTVEAARKVA
jgi:hypothetical protein